MWHCKYTQLHFLFSVPPLRQLSEAADRGGGKALFGYLPAGGSGGTEYSGGAEFAVGGSCDEELVKPAATPCGGRMGYTCLCTATTVQKFIGMWC